jgi:hypothetical protein
MKESAEPMVIYCFATEATEKTEGRQMSKIKMQNEIVEVRKEWESGSDPNGTVMFSLTLAHNPTVNAT